MAMPRERRSGGRESAAVRRPPGNVAPSPNPSTARAVANPRRPATQAWATLAAVQIPTAMSIPRRRPMRSRIEPQSGLAIMYATEKAETASASAATLKWVSRSIIGESTASTWRSTYDSQEHSMMATEATHMRQPGASSWRVSATGLIKARHPAFQLRTGSRIALEDLRIVSRNHMVARTRQIVRAAVAFQGFGYAVQHGERPALLHVGVKVRGVGGQHHVAAAGPDTDHLQTHGMAADAVQTDAGGELLIAIVKNDAPAKQFLHDGDHVFFVEGVAHRRVAHQAAGTVLHLTVLHVIFRGRKQVMIPRVVIMHMTEDHVFHARRIDPDGFQPLARRAEKIAAAAAARELIKAGIDDDGAISGHQGPDEVIQRHGDIVRVAADEVFTRHAVMVRVLDGVNLPDPVLHGRSGNFIRSEELD